MGWLLLLVIVVGPLLAIGVVSAAISQARSERVVARWRVADRNRHYGWLGDVDNALPLGDFDSLPSCRASRCLPRRKGKLTTFPGPKPDLYSV